MNNLLNKFKDNIGMGLPEIADMLNVDLDTIVAWQEGINHPTELGKEMLGSIYQAWERVPPQQQHEFKSRLMGIGIGFALNLLRGDD